MKKSYRKQVKLLFISEILSIAAAICAAFVVKSTWCGVAGFAIGIFAAVAALIAIVDLRHANDFYKRAFKFMIINVVLTVLAMIFSIIAINKDLVGGAVWAIIIAIVLNCLKMINNIIAVSDIVRGCKELVKSEKGDADFGTKSIKIYGFCVCLAIVLTILLAIPAIGNNNVANSVMSSISSICTLVAGIIYIVTLGRTVKRLK